MTEKEFEPIVKDIVDKLTALGEQVSEQRIAAIVKSAVEAQIKEPEFRRKMRFPGDDKLEGSKYARYGLGVSDVEWMHQVLSAAKSKGFSHGPSEMLNNAFRATARGMYGLPDDAFEGTGKRAMDTATTGEGLELIGAQYVGELWEAARSESRVAGLIGSFEMGAPTAIIPIEVDFPAMLHVGESTSSTVTAYTTSETASQQISATAHKFVIHQMWSGEMEEDSIIAFVPFLRRQAGKSLAYYMDSLALNGDTTLSNGINNHDTTVASTVHYTAFDGIRHTALVDNTGNVASAANGLVSLALFRAIYGRMIDATNVQDWGHPNDNNDLIHVVDPYVADHIMTIDEFLTADKAGNQATLFNGQVSKIFGHPVVSSIALKKSSLDGTIDADTAGDNLYGQIVTFNRNALKWGWRRRVKIETERIISSDQNRIVYSLRLALARYYTGGSATSGCEWADVVYYIQV